MSCHRRQFLLGAGGLLACSSLPRAAMAELRSKPTREVWVSAQGGDTDQYGLGWTASNNNPANINGKTISGFRGHGLATHPVRTRSVLLFARRPGNRGIEVDVSNGEVVAEFSCQPGRHLFGHGCFSDDGQLLFTSEAEYKTGKGKIVVRDSANYQVLEEWSSFGIGPHEVKVMPGGRSLVVANGGILTHPDQGRKPLNLETMQSSLTYIDLSSGGKLDEFFVPEPKASIRHLDVSDNGTVALAMQVQREATGHDRVVPLAGLHKPGKSIELLNNPEPVIQGMNDYMGSVAINNRTGIAGFTSPKGNIAAFWHTDSGEFAGYHNLRDVCGLAVTSDEQHFVISNSFGHIRLLDGTTLKENKSLRRKLPDYRWDNHMLAMKLS